MKKLLLIICLSSLWSCQTWKLNPDREMGSEEIDLSESDALTEIELKNFLAKATAGDARSAYIISNHYEFGVGDYERADSWLVRAAELGSSDAQFSLGTRMLESEDKSVQALGAKWIANAAKSGSVEAQNELGRDHRKGQPMNSNKP